MSGLEQIEEVAGALLRRVSPGERRRLLREVVRDIRKSQSDRIGRQQAPDGTPFEKRKPRPAPRAGKFAAHFLYPKGDPEPRVVFMKSWRREGDLIVGFDAQANAIRSFHWDRIAKWLPVEREDRLREKGKFRAREGGTFRRKGRIRRTAMFRKMRLGRHLRTGTTDSEAWIGFSGAAARIATIHQDGGLDRPAAKAKPVRYARRELLGLTEADRSLMIDAVLAQLNTL